LFKPDTENNTNFNDVSSKRASFDKVQFLKHIMYSFLNS